MTGRDDLRERWAATLVGYRAQPDAADAAFAGLRLREAGSSALHEAISNCCWLDHRANDPLVVVLALGIRAARRAGCVPRGDVLDALGLSSDRADQVGHLVDLDPARPQRPTLEEDADAAVVIDVLRWPLGSPAGPGADAVARFLHGEGVERPAERSERRRDLARRLLDSEFIYATPECRATLEGRARFRLARDVATNR